MTVVMTITRLENTLLAVSVTTDWTPPTSFDRRLWISPVRVSVKKRSGSFWRWAYSALRRSCMTLLADDVVEVRLPDTDQAADDRHDDHQRDEEVEQGEVLAPGSRRR